MKHAFAVACLAALLAATAHSQEATPKPARKRLFFLPGSKKPDPTPEPATPAAKATPKTTPKATPRATPKPEPKATPRTTPSPAAKATPKPEPPPEPKAETTPAPKPVPKPEEKLRSTTVEAMSPATPRPATPAPKPTPAKPAATPPPAKALAKATPPAATSAPEKPASPAVVTSTVPPEPAQIVRAFFALLSASDIDGAYANLMKGSKIGDRPDEVRTLKAKTKDAIEIFGAIHGYDLVDIKPVGERLMRATYLSLGHELPLRWRFYFYKAEADWKLIDLRVDDKLTGIFDEAMEEVPRPSSETRP